MAGRVSDPVLVTRENVLGSGDLRDLFRNCGGIGNRNRFERGDFRRIRRQDLALVQHRLCGGRELCHLVGPAPPPPPGVAARFGGHWSPSSPSSAGSSKTVARFASARSSICFWVFFIMKPARRALPRSVWLAVSVISVPPPSGLSRISVVWFWRCSSNGVPASSCSQMTLRPGRADTAVVHPEHAPGVRGEHVRPLRPCRAGLAVHVLDPGDPRPPVLEPAGVAHHVVYAVGIGGQDFLTADAGHGLGQCRRAGADRAPGVRASAR